VVQQVCEIAVAAEDPVVDGQAFGKPGFHDERAEPELGDQEAHHAVAEVVELVQPVRALADRHHTGVAHDVAQRFEVAEVLVARVEGAQPVGVLAEP
jgi:hypothetical protein